MNRPRITSSTLISFCVGLATSCPAGEQQVPEGKPILPRVATFQSKGATVKTIIDALARQTGLEVDIAGIDGNKALNVVFDKWEFWRVVDTLAEQSGSRVVIGELGKHVQLVPNTAGVKQISSFDRPFRFSAREIEIRRDLVRGVTIYDLTLEVAWEARLPVCRIDASPVIVKGEDDNGKPISVKPIASRVAVDGVSTLLQVRLEGITRESKQIALLKGSYRVTAAEEMLRYQFIDLGKLPTTSTQNGVGVTVKRIAKEGSFWNVEIDLKYPPDGPVFESFETYWLSRNRIALISPDGKKITTSNEEIDGTSLRYRFKETAEFKPADLKGWKLEYETTGAMREVRVNFELKGIPLP